ncbi:MAG: cryptochrome/photolyase family protein [Bacteroidales bacterium]|nr:cryptochrome/photolyase family protein [Bacteroidales bacterium]
MQSVSLVFPHQLFEKNPCIDRQRVIYISEEYLYFRQFKFHKNKIAFHRASMKFYENYLLDRGYEVIYIDSLSDLSDVRNLIPYLAKRGVREIYFCDVSDDWLEQRIKNGCESLNIKIHEFESPLFLNSRRDLKNFFNKQKRLYQTDFYVNQRKKRNILIKDNNNPAGGKWTYDKQNRLKYPAKKQPPKTVSIHENAFDKEAQTYTEKHFSHNYGSINIKYPTTYLEATIWFNDFLENRFQEFGIYEDAIVADETILNHSVLSPMLNIGLLLPMNLIQGAIDYSEKNNISLNSTEGFVRQILGWREFIRAVYELKGTEERTKNYWKFSRKIPESFWNGTTGIEPVDLTIKKVLRTGYCHHIERLMVLGNFMLLCEFDPDEVYCWFMELFIDAYDWVMVPNVYGMSQFADGGLMSTKPYISGSNYLMKMGNYQKGDWQNVWDGLFWSFLHKHRDFFRQNPRLGMMVKIFDNMHVTKQNTHLIMAERFLNSL